jgi:gamma-glutamyltranspeptidase/glutathione hydrolase/leukotriene-C4 hydrolase
VDADRNAVAMTTTINFPFGSKLLSPSTGIILNNEMDDFAIPSFVPPGHLPPPPQNFVAPDKRPLSSMSPTIVLQNGQLRAVLGGSGGQMIITAVVQVLMNHFMKKISPFYSISAARVHHQVFPLISPGESVILMGGAIRIPFLISHMPSDHLYGKTTLSPYGEHFLSASLICDWCVDL